RQAMAREMCSAAAMPNPALNKAAIAALAAITRGAEKTSATLNTASSSAPTTNPNCTDSVNQEPSAKLACQMLVSCGSTAVPANQSDMAISSEMERTNRVRRAFGSIGRRIVADDSDRYDGAT